MRPSEWKTRLRRSVSAIVHFLERYRMTVSIAALALLHLTVLFLWPAKRVERAILARAPQVVQLTELRLAPPLREDGVLQKKDDATINIGEKRATQEKTQKKTSPASGAAYLPSSQVDRQPLPLIDIQSILTYPDQARRMRIQGVVVVELDISAAGVVNHIRLMQKAGWGFDGEVLRKLRLVRFRPALKAREPVAVTVRLPVEFILR